MNYVWSHASGHWFEMCRCHAVPMSSWVSTSVLSYPEEIVLQWSSLTSDSRLLSDLSSAMVFEFWVSISHLWLNTPLKLSVFEPSVSVCINHHPLYKKLLWWGLRATLVFRYRKWIFKAIWCYFHLVEHSSSGITPGSLWVFFNHGFLAIFTITCVVPS